MQKGLRVSSLAKCRKITEQFIPSDNETPVQFCHLSRTFYDRDLNQLGKLLNCEVTWVDADDVKTKRFRDSIQACVDKASKP